MKDDFMTMVVYALVNCIQTTFLQVIWKIIHFPIYIWATQKKYSKHENKFQTKIKGGHA